MCNSTYLVGCKYNGRACTSVRYGEFGNGRGGEKGAVWRSFITFLATLALGAGLPLPLPANRPDERADTVYFNGKVLTADAAQAPATAFAVGGGRFIAVGTDRDIRTLAAPGTVEVDLDGATVIPGLFDSHDHLWNSAKFLHRGVDMKGVATRAEFDRRLAAAVAGTPRGKVVFTTTGWSFQPGINRQQLDAISATAPIAAISYRRGMAVFNTAALERLGISRANPRFRGVPVPVGPDGEPNGTMPGFPFGLYMIDALLPRLTKAEQDAMVIAEMRQRNALGITSIRELAVWPSAYEALKRIRREGKFTLRMAVGIEFPDHKNAFRAIAKLPAPDRRDQWLFLDAIGEEPWTPGVVSRQQFTSLIMEMRRRGWRPAPHVNSDLARGISADAATESTLGAYQDVDRVMPLSGQRWYVEHVPFATEPQQQIMARLGLIVSVQDAALNGVAPTGLSPERLAQQNPVRSMLRNGVRVIGGSDYAGPSVEEPAPNNPMRLIQFYVTRRNLKGQDTTLAERVTREEALRMFTSVAAYAVFQENQRGRIAPGLLADFVILDHDFMNVPAEQIEQIRPLATFVGGRMVYAAAHYRP